MKCKLCNSNLDILSSQLYNILSLNAKTDSFYRNFSSCSKNPNHFALLTDSKYFYYVMNEIYDKYIGRAIYSQFENKTELTVMVLDHFGNVERDKTQKIQIDGELELTKELVESILISGEMWINIDMSLNYVDEELRNKIIEEKYNVKKPLYYPPHIERDVKKELGYSKKNLIDKSKELFGSNSYKFETESDSHDPNIFKNFKKFLEDKVKYERNVSKYDFYEKENLALFKTLYNKKDKVFEFIEEQKKYNKYYKNNEKIKNYFDHKKKYYDLKDLVAKEICFTLSDYNRPGMLVQLQSSKTNQFSSFLIGSKSNIVAYFPKTSKVFRVKRLIDEQDIVEDLIFM